MTGCRQLSEPATARRGTAMIDRAASNQYHFSPDSTVPTRASPMLRVSRLTDYATVVMTCIAAHPTEVLSTVQIADETHLRSEEHTSELQSLMRHSYAVFCLKKKKN